jgi:hypothetical protein
MQPTHGKHRLNILLVHGALSDGRSGDRSSRPSNIRASTSLPAKSL